MKPLVSLNLRAELLTRRPLTRLVVLPIQTHHHIQRQCLHSKARQRASVDPSWIGTGLPPEPPVDIAREEREWWAARRREHRADLHAATESRKRFWRHTSVRRDKDDTRSLVVFLDERPLRHPTTKRVVRLPPSKAILATALAAEWDQLTASTQANKGHLIPLTSLVCRALDIIDSDASGNSSYPTIRSTIVDSLLRYLDTDSLLCWEPSVSSDPKDEDQARLREKQIAAFESVTAPLMNSETGAWTRAGVSSLRGVLDPAGGLFPQGQEEGVRDAVGRWVAGLDAWELAGLERAVLSGKSLVAAARLIVDWSEGVAGRKGLDPVDVEKRFGAEEAVRATNVEVDWQVGRWGEVQDSHDVDREDLRRHFGSVVLLVSGVGAQV